MGVSFKQGKNNIAYSFNSMSVFSFGFSNIHGSDSSSDFRVCAADFGHFAQMLDKLYIFLTWWQNLQGRP